MTNYILALGRGIFLMQGFGIAGLADHFKQVDQSPVGFVITDCHFFNIVWQRITLCHGGLKRLVGVVKLFVAAFRS